MTSPAAAAIRAAVERLGQNVELVTSPDAICARVAALAIPAPANHLGDVCLAAACLEGDYRATEYLIVRYSQPMRVVVRRTCLVAADAEDIVQDVLVKVLVGRPPAPPALAAYRGQGPLQAWLSVVAARAAVDLVRRPQALSLADTLLSAISVADEATPLVTDQRKRSFKQAVEGALGDLDKTDRQVLRLHLTGLVAEQIGRSMGLHRVSVARRLSALRAKLRENTLTRLGAAADEVADDVSQLSVSIERLLGPSPADLR